MAVSGAAACVVAEAGACVVGLAAAGMVDLEAVGMVAEEEATGNRICGGKQFLSRRPKWR